MDSNLWKPGLAIVVGICVFILCREFMMWYWKIDRVLQVPESIDRKLGGGPPAA